MEQEQVARKDYRMLAAYYVKGVRPTDNESMPKSKPNPRICKAQRKSKQAAAPTTSMHHRWDFVFNPAEWYDPTKTISENLTAIASPTKWKKAYGFDGKKIARNTLIAALQKQHIATYEERKENAIICAYIWGAESAKDLQKCGVFTLDPKTARKRFNDFESGRTSEITSESFYFWMLNRINRKAKEHNFNEIKKKGEAREFYQKRFNWYYTLYTLTLPIELLLTFFPSTSIPKYLHSFFSFSRRDSAARHKA